MPGVRPVLDMFVLVCSIKVFVSDLPDGWPQDHGPTKFGAMVKNKENKNRALAAPFTLHSSLCTVYSELFTLYFLLHAFSLQFFLCIFYPPLFLSNLYSALFTLHVFLCIIYFARFTLHFLLWAFKLHCLIWNCGSPFLLCTF